MDREIVLPGVVVVAAWHDGMPNVTNECVSIVVVEVTMTTMMMKIEMTTTWMRRPSSCTA
jgi:hypothetical protein